MASAALPALAGRTIQVVTDLSREEQLYLYEHARQLKLRHTHGNGSSLTDAPPLVELKELDALEPVNDPDCTVYLLFMESSTRTKESLRNAAVFHHVKVNEFQAETSSFTKSETITDTMKMLSLYSTGRSVFAIRSPLEGVCRWLETVLPMHAEKFGIPSPCFVNAGDGRYSHPLGELVDVFSILEQLRWDLSEVHVALVGDLAHGRTAHSKVDSLRIFAKVRVDLVAPTVLAYPVEYRTKMRANGFEVREFGSLEEYLTGAAGSLATVWYFYKPQFQRCGDLALNAKNELSSKVTFKAEWLSELPQSARFFQTLPRDKEHPIVPLSFDELPLNTWDRVANNAYFLHTVLLGLLFGSIGKGLAESPRKNDKKLPWKRAMTSPNPLRTFAEAAQNSHLPSFVEEVVVSPGRHARQPERARPGGAVPISDGVVVDHIRVGPDPAACWQRLRQIRTILGWSRHVGSEGVYSSSSRPNQFKGILCMPNFDFKTLTVPEMKALASIAPGSTINAISESSVVGKYRMKVPERIYNLPNIHCKNTLCVSNPKNKQRDVVAVFIRVPFYETSVLPGCEPAEYLFVCKYCQWPHQYKDIWADSSAGNT